MVSQLGLGCGVLQVSARPARFTVQPCRLGEHEQGLGAQVCAGHRAGSAVQSLGGFKGTEGPEPKEVCSDMFKYPGFPGRDVQLPNLLRCPVTQTLLRTCLWSQLGAIPWEIHVQLADPLHD